MRKADNDNLPAEGEQAPASNWGVKQWYVLAYPVVFVFAVFASIRLIDWWATSINQSRQAAVQYNHARTYQAAAKAVRNASVSELLERAEELGYAGEYEEAETVYQRALIILEKANGNNAPELIELLKKLAEVYSLHNKFSEAEATYQRALIILEKANGNNAPELIELLKKLAEAHASQRKFSEAEATYQRALIILEKANGNNAPELIELLKKLAEAHASQRKFSEAEATYQRALSTLEKANGNNAPELIELLKKLAEVYSLHSKFSEAEATYQRVLTILHKAHDDFGLLDPLVDLVAILDRQGRFSEAEIYLQRVLSIQKSDALLPSLDRLDGVIDFYEARSRPYDANRVRQHLIAIRKHEAALLENDKSVDETGGAAEDLSYAYNRVAKLYRELNESAEAEAYYLRGLKAIKSKYGKNDGTLCDALFELVSFYEEQSRDREATQSRDRAATAMRNRISEIYALDKDAKDAECYARVLKLFGDQGRLGDIEDVLKRQIAEAEKQSPPNRGAVLHLSKLADLYESRGRPKEAEELLKKALAIKSAEKTIKGVSDLDPPILGLVALYSAQGRYADSEKLLDNSMKLIWRANQAREKQQKKERRDARSKEESQKPKTQPKTRDTNGTEEPQEPKAKQEADGLFDFSGIGAAAEAAGAAGEAAAKAAAGALDVSSEVALRVLLDLEVGRFDVKETVGHGHSANDAFILGQLAVQYGRRGAFELAFATSRRAMAAFESSEAALAKHQSPLRSFFASKVAQDSPGSQYLSSRLISKVGMPLPLMLSRNHVMHIAALGRSQPEKLQLLGREAFESAQRANNSEAAQAVQQMALRVAAGERPHIAFIREAQDLEVLKRKLEQRLGQAQDKREYQTRDRLQRQIDSLDDHLATALTRLEKEFPDIRALVNRKPLKLDEGQKLLGAEEALILFLTAEKESYVFALSRTRFAWRMLPIGEKALADKVATLRRGLDDPVSVKRGLARTDECHDAGRDPRGLGRLECGGFDLGGAYELYRTLFGPIADVINDKKQLIVVPSGVLTSLPFQVLVTNQGAPPQALSKAAWLINRHALTVLPSVASLETLRTIAKDGRGSKPFIGFGDPVFQKGTPAGGQRLVSASVRPVSEYFQRARANREATGKLRPLPDTAVELREIAKNFGESEILLGANASERTVKELSEKGQLASYRIVHFATHGLVAGNIKDLAEPARLAEPALALSVPDQPSDIDDGLLTASEVALLKLNSDWVVLSACETAAGDQPGAEALSGLARAFFYAGARTLLVSHWPVDSRAAVKLTTRTFAELKAHPEIGRAEALRRAMLALMQDKSDPSNAHPAVWAPFMVVGEGGADPAKGALILDEE
jgi:CHAT domain-containing protein